MKEIKSCFQARPLGYPPPGTSFGFLLFIAGIILPSYAQGIFLIKFKVGGPDNRYINECN